LNSGPGNIGALFLHEKHFDRLSKKLDGWWGHELKTRFEMSNGLIFFLIQRMRFLSLIFHFSYFEEMKYAHGASAFALSTPPSILFSCLSSSLKVNKF
jgi:kynureninase